MVFNDDEKPPASNAGSTKGLVTIKTPTYSKDDVALTADAVTAVVELNATSSTAVREGLDLVAVLDVSGSMEGTKLQSMKTAMHFVVMKLTPVDRISIVSFTNSATRLCPLRSITQAAQTDLKAIIDGLVADGGTNIEVGMETVSGPTTHEGEFTATEDGGPAQARPKRNKRGPSWLADGHWVT